MISILVLVFGLALILGMCELFTNAVERVGKRFDLGSGPVGSVLAAVGTALPETLVPILALLVSHDPKAQDIGVGAIAGAPFMLATLGFAVTGAGVLFFAMLGKRPWTMDLALGTVKRDLGFFLAFYGMAVAATFIPWFAVRAVIAALLVIGYVVYVRCTFADEANLDGDVDRLILGRFLPNGFALEIIQAVLAVGGILAGAWLFIDGVSQLSAQLAAPALLVSIIVTPIATELPEKFNSVLWTRRGKDSLALGNMTGAMVFQCCFPVALGLVCSPWHLTGNTLLSAIIALTSAAFVLAWVRIRGSLHPGVLLGCGGLYLVFIIRALVTR